ncbi:KTSC domain-containing protein [Chitinophaga sp. Cy-1792]|uniref:KTSC domain-containing protein n=1 Tax=Chitinophaga sp. Cy-1792 TaxID=2608339 RepID=UPI00351A0E20
MVAYYHYSPARKVLRVTYTSGKVYDYLQVPATVYEALKAAISKGTFLNQYIKGHYNYKLIN